MIFWRIIGAKHLTRTRPSIKSFRFLNQPQWRCQSRICLNRWWGREIVACGWPNVALNNKTSTRAQVELAWPVSNDESYQQNFALSGSIKHSTQKSSCSERASALYALQSRYSMCHDEKLLFSPNTALHLSRRTELVKYVLFGKLLYYSILIWNTSLPKWFLWITLGLYRNFTLRTQLCRYNTG